MGNYYQNLLIIFILHLFVLLSFIFFIINDHAIIMTIMIINLNLVNHQKISSYFIQYHLKCILIEQMKQFKGILLRLKTFNQIFFNSLKVII